MSSFLSPSISQQEINAFVLAARKGDNDTIGAMLDQYGTCLLDAQAEDKDNKGATALIMAISCTGGEGFSASNTVILLLEKGANINAKNTEGETPLMYAALQGKKDVVRFLLNRGADATVKDNNGQTAAVWAETDDYADMSHMRAIAALLRQAENVATQGSVPVLTARASRPTPTAKPGM